MCYVDEAGGSDLLCESAPTSSPVLVIAGLIVPEDQVRNLVWDYLQLKKDYNPSLAAANKKLSDVIATEVKGANLRTDIKSESRRQRRRAFGFLDRTIALLERHAGRVIARILVKSQDVVVRDAAVYGTSILWLCSTFHQYLEERSSQGLIVLDSRTKVKNTPNADVVTTQMFRHGGNPLPRLVEVPVFGHSDSHVCLQIADVVASALLFPAACYAYCQDHTWNHHAKADYSSIVARYGSRIKDLQYRYHDAAVGYWKGGIFAYGTNSSLRARLMFDAPPIDVPIPGIEGSELT